MFGAIISGVLGAAGGAFGSAGRNAAADAQQALINKSKRDNENWYNKRYYEDPTQRVSAQAMLARTEKFLQDRNKSAEARKAVIGGTNASIAAEKEATSNTMGNLTAQIAAAGDARQDAIEQQYLKRKHELENKEAEIESTKANAFDMMGNVLGGFGNGMSLGNLGGGK